MKLKRRVICIFMVIAMLFSTSAEAFAEVGGLRLSDDLISIVDPESDISDEIEIIDPELVSEAQDDKAAAQVGLRWRALDVFPVLREEKDESAARFWALLLDRSVEAMEKENEDGTENRIPVPSLTVQGWLPDDVSAQAVFSAYEEGDLSVEQALMNVEIRLTDGRGNAWRPRYPLIVSVGGEAVEAARYSEKKFTVYDYAETELNADTIPSYVYLVRVFKDFNPYVDDPTVAALEAHADIVSASYARFSKDERYPSAVSFKMEAPEMTFALTAQPAPRAVSAASGEAEVSVEGDLPEEVTAQIEPVDTAVIAETLDEPVLAWDISLKTGEEEYQPGEKVTVTLTDPAIAVALAEGKRLQLWHLRHDADPELVEGAVFEGDTVRFETDGFSVYVVSADQRGYCFKFVNPEKAEYTELRQTVYDGDTLVEPVAPSDHGRVFVKWVWKGMEGTDENFTDFSFTYDSNNPGKTPFLDNTGKITVPTTQRGMVDVVITAAFTDEDYKQYHILFNDQNEEIYNQNTYRTGTRVDPNGTEDPANKVSYVVIQKKTGQYLTFAYWTEDLYDLDASTGKPKPFEPEIIDRDITLYPYCPQAHWLNFDANKAAANNQSIAFTAPMLVLEGEVPTSVPHPTANGYTFDGWYTRPGDSDQIYDASGAAVAATAGSGWTYAYQQYLYTGGDSLDYDPTLYAHWTKATTATYTVSYWVQKPTDAVDATNAEKKYDFYTMHSFTTQPTATVGTTVGITGSGADTIITPYTAAKVVEGTAVDPSGLKLNTANSNTVTVEADGSTTLRVYYDRKDYTIRFYNKDSNVNGNNFGTEYTQYRIHELYGHDIEAQWNATKNPSVSNLPQWRTYKNANSNVTIRFVMPAVESMSSNEAYYHSGNVYELRYIRGASGTYSYTYNRIAHLENLDDDGYTEDSAYLDSRKMTGTNTVISAEILSGIDGFTLIRVEGREYEDYNNSNSQTANYQYVRDQAYRNPGISSYTTDASKNFRYIGKSGSSTYKVDAYYKRNTNMLILRYKVDGAWVTDITADKAPVAGAAVAENGSALTWNAVKYGASLSAYLYDYASDHGSLKNVENKEKAWWFWDEGLTNPVKPADLANKTMPDYPVVLYEGLKTSYEVNVDPQGGELDGITQSTWFNLGRDEAASEYSVTRDYVEWSELYASKDAIPDATKLYKYVYNIRDMEPRSAKYVEMTDTERADDSITAYVYYPGLWQFQYWYEDGHPNTPFAFTTPPNKAITLMAKWVHAGNYSIVYNADNGGRSYRVPKDPELYLEGSQAVIKSSLDQPGDKQFRFWATKPQEGTSLTLTDGAEKFLPNERLTVDAKYTPGQLEQNQRTITLYAWYESGSFTSDSFANYEFYLPESDGTWKDGQEGRENKPYYVQTISPGETLILPVMPTGSTAPAGTFIGWYLDPEFKDRFTGFGEISTPINRKLYARYAEVHTVTYKESADGRTISVQTYFDGDLLSTLGVEFTTTTDKYVAWWAGNNNINYSYMGKGVNLSVPGDGYSSASDVVKNGRVKGDLVLIPVTHNVYNLSFDSQGGSYVAPIEMPHDYNRWVAEPLPTRKGYNFLGWFTAPEGETNSLSTTVGGIRYLFNGPLTNWATDNGINLTQNNPLRLYAHWQRDTSVKLDTTVKINYWIQNTDRTGYFLWSSETVDKHSNGTKISVSDTYNLTEDQKSTAKIAGYKTFSDDSTDDKDWFVLSTAASGENDDFVSYATETSKTVEENGATTLNVYFNRKTFTLRFSPDWSEKVSERVAYRDGWFSTSYQDADVTYTVNGSVNSKDPYETTVWLGKDMSSSWPQYGSSNFETTHSNVSANWGYTAYSESQWVNTYYFTGWTEYTGTTNNATGTFNNVAAAQSYVGKKLLPNGGQTTYTLRAQYVANSNPDDSAVTVHYMLKRPGATGSEYTTDNYYEATEYEQVMYGVSGPNWNTILGQATPIAGYVREDHKEAKSINETVYIPLYTYSIPAKTYYHRFGNWGNLLYAEISVSQKAHNGNSTSSAYPAGRGVREGQFSFTYRYLLGPTYALSNTDGVYQMNSHAATHNSFEVEKVMSVNDLRAILEASRGEPTGYDQVKYSGTHVYLYYDMQSYKLTLMSAETGETLLDKDDHGNDIKVQYSKFLTNEDGTLGYIREASGLNYTPPSYTGRSFAYWSLSKDSTSPWEGVMPDQNFTLWAHYEDTQVTVTTVGVQPNGELQRDLNSKAIIRDTNGLPDSWSNDKDSSDEYIYSTNDFVSLRKSQGTRLQEFELPIPALESGEIFYGWRRVENGKMVGGYLSNTQQITGDIVVAPVITVNKGGVVAYYANGATNEGLANTTKYEVSGFLFEEGNYYFGATAKAKFGTVSGGTVSASNPQLVKGGFAFVCWNTKADGGGDSYYPGDAIALPDTGVVKLYAQYSSKREITLVYHMNIPSGTNGYTGDPALPGFVKMPLDGTFTEELVDRELNGTRGIERDKTNTSEKVLRIFFADYLTDSTKFPNSQYPSNVDSEGNHFIPYCPGYTFLSWNTARDGSDETSLRTDDIRINTLGKDAYGEIHLYAQWDEIVLPVQVYEVIPGNMNEQFRLRVINNYNSYLKTDSYRAETALNTAVEWYKADVRHGVDPKDTYLKSVLSNDEVQDPKDEVEIRFVRFNDTSNTWQYATTEGVTEVSSVPAEDWMDFLLGDELKIYYQRPQYMVYFNYNGGTDADNREYRGESAEAAFSGTNTAELPVISDVSRNGYKLVGWSIKTPRADLAENAALPTDNDFYAINPDDPANNDVIPITKTGSGNTLAFTAGRTTGTRVTLYQAYTESLNAKSILYAVWQKSPWVCQITNGDTLLYYNSAATGTPVYTEAKFTSIRAAYDAMSKLYVRSGTEGNYTYTPYSAKLADAAGKDTRLEMLVDKYNLQNGDTFTWTNNYKLTWTTAASVTTKPCEIIRGNVGTNFNLGHCDLTLQRITLNNSGKGSADGGIWDLKETDSKLTLDNGATLQNAVASGHGGAVDLQNGKLIMNDGAVIQNCDGNTLGGGAVYLHGNTSFIMNGGTITNCKSARGGAVYLHTSATFTMNGGTIENCSSLTGTGHGGAVDIEGGTFTMNGGTIRNCSAKNNGGAIHIHTRDKFIMNGGTITGCSAEGHGSVIYTMNHVTVTLTGGTITGNTVSDTYRAIYLGGADCRLNISGSPVIYDNVTDGGQQRNIDISSVTNNTVNDIITVVGALDATAKIGVYAPTGHDMIGEQFGNYISGVSTENFSVFKNDKNIYLVGTDGGSNKLVWGPVICKIVETKTEDGNTVKIEHVFASLNEAVAYARTNGAAMSSTNPIKIEMLVDYEIPSTDKVNLNGAKDNIILTTAPTSASFSGELYLFKSTENPISARKDGDSTATAIIARKSDFTDDSFITVGHTSAALTLANVTLDGSSVTLSVDGGLVNGGLVKVSGGALTMDTGATLRNAITSDSGGAVYLANSAVMTMSTGTITGNTAATGAGIYVAQGAKLKLSGSPSFGSGNFSSATADTGATNGGESYSKYRQDIYLYGTGNPLNALTLTENLANTTAPGSIWVWAAGGNNAQNHYKMLKQFAVLDDGFTGEVTETTYKAFRNARPDAETDCGGDYLTGQKGEVATNIYWTGGFDVRFLKVDGFGNPLPGATFALYESQTDGTPKLEDEKLVPYKKGDLAVTATSADGTNDKDSDGTTIPKGITLFQKVAPKTYYMVETDMPTEDADGNAATYEANTKLYKVVVGADGSLTIHEAPYKATVDTTGVSIEAVTGATEKEVYKANTAAEGDPELIQYQIMNVSTETRPVILTKINKELKPLQYGEFKILRYDGTALKHTVNGTETDIFTSDQYGIYYYGQLPLGTYLVQETKAPTDDYKLPDHYFVFKVTEKGVMNETMDLTGTKTTNTIFESTSQDYLTP